jgi:hypothetical protein
MNMPARGCALSRALATIALALTASLAPPPAARCAETATIGDLVFVNKALVAVGRLPSDLRDKFGETTSSPKTAFRPARPTRTQAGSRLTPCS